MIRKDDGSASMRGRSMRSVGEQRRASASAQRAMISAGEKGLSSSLRIASKPARAACSTRAGRRRVRTMRCLPMPSGLADRLDLDDIDIDARRCPGGEDHAARYVLRRDRLVAAPLVTLHHVRMRRAGEQIGAADQAWANFGGPYPQWSELLPEPDMNGANRVFRRGVDHRVGVDRPR